MFEHVHIFLDESKSSDSWPDKCFIIELPGVDYSFSSETVILSKVLPDLHGVVKILNIKTSGEPLHLSFEFPFSVVESFVASCVGGSIDGLRLT